MLKKFRDQINTIGMLGIKLKYSIEDMAQHCNEKEYIYLHHADYVTSFMSWFWNTSSV